MSKIIKDETIEFSRFFDISMELFAIGCAIIASTTNESKEIEKNKFKNLLSFTLSDPKLVDNVIVGLEKELQVELGEIIPFKVAFKFFASISFFL